MSKKLEHGRYSIELHTDCIVICELIGTFNKEGVAAWILEMHSTIETIKEKPFGILIDVRHYAGATEDALEAADSFHQWLGNSMLVCQAHVISSPTLYSISISRLPSLKLHEVKSFLRIDEACAWIVEKLKKQNNIV